jgi:hypothetical protein
MAQITHPFSTMVVEPKLHLVTDVLARPMDISFTPNIPESPCSTFTSVGFDLTITKSPPPPKQDITSTVDCIHTLTANADTNLQDFERNKLNRKTNTAAEPSIPGDAVIGNLLNNQAVLIPLAIDGHGRLGPMFNAFLYGTPQPPIPPRKQFKPSRPNAKAMYHRATNFPSPLGILHTADYHWKATTTSQRDRQFFGHSHTAPTPSITTTQLIGLGIVKGLSHHILKSTRNLVFSSAHPPFDLMDFLLPKHLECPEITNLANVEVET